MAPGAELPIYVLLCPKENRSFIEYFIIVRRALYTVLAPNSAYILPSISLSVTLVYDFCAPGSFGASKSVDGLVSFIVQGLQIYYLNY